MTNAYNLRTHAEKSKAYAREDRLCAEVAKSKRLEAEVERLRAEIKTWQAGVEYKDGRRTAFLDAANMAERFSSPQLIIRELRRAAEGVKDG